MEGIKLESSMESSDLGGYLLQKKIEVMIEANNKKVAVELSNLNKSISKLNVEIDEIKRQLSEARTSETTNSSRNEEKEESQSAVNTITITNTEKKSDLPKPRYGDYKSEDVAIDKVFYFGGKRS